MTIPQNFWSELKRQAKRRKIKFELTVEYVEKLLLNQSCCCALTGCPLHFASPPQRYYEGNASLDRIDSNEGYVEGNVQWVEKQVNLAKGSLPVKDFKKLCREVFKHDQKV